MGKVTRVARRGSYARYSYFCGFAALSVVGWLRFARCQLVTAALVRAAKLDEAVDDNAAKPQSTDNRQRAVAKATAQNKTTRVSAGRFG
jgi:hypothetical protein